MNKKSKKPCYPEYSTGNGTAVAEALGNWGFSNGRTIEGGISRLKKIFNEMDKLKTNKGNMQVVYSRKNDPEAWLYPPSPAECKPSWNFPEKRPLITFNSSVDIIYVSSLASVKNELANPAPGREYRAQGSPKWFKVEPMGSCYQPRCCAPQHSCTRPH
ncbi:uncharacterized protein LOC130667391 [Microplitis mediator]|uniref:uncharacterized protein LOC130667391 n=1 Tax=Microplitis mediator TaxID=375433 RepID=UPI002555E209|nr:uncharacterized protein LOC130667391 [Microplitis mediator]